MLGHCLKTGRTQTSYVFDWKTKPMAVDSKAQQQNALNQLHCSWLVLLKGDLGGTPNGHTDFFCTGAREKVVHGDGLLTGTFTNGLGCDFPSN